MSRILDAGAIKHEIFDPTNESHLESLLHFVQTGSWGNVHFQIEGIGSSVPDSVMRKFTKYAVEILLNEKRI